MVATALIEGGDESQLGTQIEWLRMGDLVMDRYQRPVDLGLVRKISRSFRPELCNVLVVNRRLDGTLACIDGQHRGKGMIAGTGPDTRWPCQMHYGLTYEQEAALFVALNKERRPMSVVDAFHAAVEAREPEAMEIVAILERIGYGLRTANGTGRSERGQIQAIGAVVTVYRRYRPGMLELTLGTIHGAFGSKPAPNSGSILGCATFLSRYSDKYDAGRLLDVMRKLTMQRWEAEASDYKRVMGSGSGNGTGAGFVLTKYYNRGLGESKRLPEWTEAGLSHSPVRNRWAPND